MAADDGKENVLVSGFIHELFEHDPVAFSLTPHDIHDLVERYYIEMKQWKREKKRIADQLNEKLTHPRRPTITDLGDMHIIPHEYLDNLLEEAVARIQHIQERLQRHLPEPVAHTLAETLVNDGQDEDGDHEEELVWYDVEQKHLLLRNGLDKS